MNIATPSTSTLTKQEVLNLAAVDDIFFARTFFGKTFRQKSPEAHHRVWSALADPSHRYVNLKMARDFAKTTISRTYTAKRIAYGLSHTVLYISGNEGHASRSLLWLQSRIATREPGGAFARTPFAQFYGLHPGRKWNETEMEVINEPAGDLPIWIVGAGILGSVRGLNFDDYRPDLIYCDDILKDSNTASEDQRDKINELIFGAVKESLAPASEEPNAKLVLSQTPQWRGDISEVAEQDPTFLTVNVPCWTPETADLPVELQISAWEDRYPTDLLRSEKRNAIAMNRYSVFAREKEVKIVKRETAAFHTVWLKTRTAAAPPMYCVLAIDPVPPPSAIQLAKGLKNKDFEAQVVVGRRKGEYHVLEYIQNRGHEPNWSVSTALALATRWKVAKIVVEAVAYQKVLGSLLATEMKRRGTYWLIEDFKDHRDKYTRITGELSGPASQGMMWVEPGMDDFLTQFESYPGVDHDDLLDAVSIAMMRLVNPFLEPGTPQPDDDDAFTAWEFVRNCP